ncbi:MAG: DUF362 domain-containing protein [Planctomycetota bacterium]|nr:DUF362 domain-containing protein [Planctomycetota bacterium]
MKPKVHLFRCSSDTPLAKRQEAIASLLGLCNIFSRMPDKGPIAVKTHFGEGKCTGYIRPEMIKPAVDMLDVEGYEPFLTDTNTLYKGRRHNSVQHLRLAHEHGFSFETLGCPVIISDGLRGNNEELIEISGERFESVPIAGDIVCSRGIVVFSHFTGHIAAGFGAAIKNLAMGCSPRRGKLMQHASMHPWVEQAECIACGTCEQWCPEDAIEMRPKAYILDDRCVGCGECITVCPTMAVKFSWKQEHEVLVESMAEFAAAAVKAVKGRAVFLNVLMHVSKGCDCLNKAQERIAPDIGILASTDPVAIDKASLDMFSKTAGKPLNELIEQEREQDGMQQLRHAVKMGLGDMEYELNEVEV